jgi:hypothetical protein
MHTDIRELEGVCIEHIDQSPRLTVGERNNQISVLANVGENYLGRRCSGGAGDGPILPVANVPTWVASFRFPARAMFRDRSPGSHRAFASRLRPVSILTPMGRGRQERDPDRAHAEIVGAARRFADGELSVTTLLGVFQANVVDLCRDEPLRGVHLELFDAIVTWDREAGRTPEPSTEDLLMVARRLANHRAEQA